MKSTRIVTIRSVLFAVLALTSVTVDFASAQTAEIAPGLMERTVRNYGKSFRTIVPQNCKADRTWFSGNASAVRSDMKVIIPTGATYTCKECISCGGITCETPRGKPIYVATHCSGADGEVDF